MEDLLWRNGLSDEFKRNRVTTVTPPGLAASCHLLVHAATAGGEYRVDKI
jgi:hypothetical protein